MRSLIIQDYVLARSLILLLNNLLQNKAVLGAQFYLFIVYLIKDSNYFCLGFFIECLFKTFLKKHVDCLSVYFFHVEEDNIKTGYSSDIIGKLSKILKDLQKK